MIDLPATLFLYGVPSALILGIAGIINGRRKQSSWVIALSIMVVVVAGLALVFGLWFVIGLSMSDV